MLLLLLLLLLIIIIIMICKVRTASSYLFFQQLNRAFVGVRRTHMPDVGTLARPGAYPSVHQVSNIPSEGSMPDM
jgi:hypothetical protein